MSSVLLCLDSRKSIVHYVSKKAATVPQIAIVTPVATIIPSNQPHFPAITTFAMTGPTIESMKAEKEPRNAIIELNSGTATETATASVVKKTRCKIANKRFHPKFELPGATDSPSGLSTRPSEDEIGVSIPSNISTVVFSCKLR